MELGLAGKVALVPAASRGIGRACAFALAREGADVAICARDATSLAATAEELRAATGRRVFAAPADLGDAASIATFLAGARAALGPAHVVVANALGPRPGWFREVDDADWLAAVEGILFSTVRLVRSVLPDLIANGGGAVIAIQSASTKQPVEHLTLSNGVRPAILGLFKTLANEYGPQQIRFNVVNPGRIRTERLLAVEASHGGDLDERLAHLAAEIPLRRLGAPEDVADLVTFLASERARYVSGTVINVDGGNQRGIF